MIQNDIALHSVPVLAIPTHGGGYRGAWSIGREYLSTERQRVGRFARFTTTLNHPQVKGRVIALLDMTTAKTEIYVEQFELSPDLVTRCYAIAGVSLDARYTNTGAGPARLNTSDAWLREQLSATIEAAPLTPEGERDYFSQWVTKPNEPSTPKVSFRGIRDTSSLPSEPEIVDAIRDAAYVALVNQTYEDVTGVQYPPVLGADFSFREVVVDETTGLCTAIVVDTAGNLGGEPGQEYLLKDGFVRAGGDGQEIDPSKPVELTFNYLSDSEELGKAIFEAIMGTTKPDWMVLVDKDGNPIPEDARWEDLPDDLRNAILTKMGAKPKE